VKFKRQGKSIKINIKEVNDDSNSNSSISKKKGSDVWNYFNKYKDNNSVLCIKYYQCDKGIYNMSGLNSSTGNLIKHLKLHLDKTNPSIKK